MVKVFFHKKKKKKKFKIKNFKQKTKKQYNKYLKVAIDTTQVFNRNNFVLNNPQKFLHHFPDYKQNKKEIL